MDFPEPTTPKAAAEWRRAAWVAAVVALLAFAEILFLNVGAVAGGSDSSGYLNHAKLLLAGTVHAQPRVIAGLPLKDAPGYLYVPLGFSPAPGGNAIVPTYPMGLSLFIVAFKLVMAWNNAAAAVMVLHAAAGVIATYWLARLMGLSRPWSVLCAAAVALSPLYLFMSQKAMSDVPSLAWTTFAVIAALRSRERPFMAVVAGLAMSIDVLLRPTNVLALLP
ncbi:MAG TPA: hypothetical protein VFE25_06810, partial [Opitutaceae bacterium]|nr:hypothetical protein [Opitutaceae bacterium]